jgi:multidrug efflux pump subunit AcrA (membrane-fusion protein)
MRKELNKGILFGTALVALSATAIMLSGCSGSNAANAATTNSMQSATTPQSTVYSTTSKPASTANPTSAKTSISLSIPNRNIKAGDVIKIDVVIDTDQMLRSGQCGLMFDQTLLRCDKVDEGGFFKNWADAQKIQTMVLPQAQIDNTKGTISTLGDALMGMVPGGATGTGTFCTYSFTALKDGNISPKLTDVELGVQQGDYVVALDGVKINN